MGVREEIWEGDLMGFDEMESEEYQLRRIRQRKAFKSHWVKIFALSPPDDCLIDTIIDAIEKA